MATRNQDSSTSHDILDPLLDPLPPSLTLDGLEPQLLITSLSQVADNDTIGTSTEPTVPSTSRQTEVTRLNHSNQPDTATDHPTIMKPKQLLLSSQQCTMLMKEDSNKRSKYKELCFPFNTNPNVEITFIQSSKRTLIEFSGKPDTVNTAYEYFETNLKSTAGSVDSEIPVDRLTWAGLIERKPAFLQFMQEKYGTSFLYSNGCLRVNETQRGSIEQAIVEVKDQLSKCKVCLMKSQLSLPLLASLKLRLRKDSNSVVIFEHEGLQYICSESDSENTIILEMVEHKCISQFVNANAKIIETVRNDRKWCGKPFDTVEVSFQERRIELKSYISSNVFAAKKSLLDIVRPLKCTRKSLSCSPLINAYIHYVLSKGQMSADQKTLLSSLSVKVITENNSVYLEGSPGAVETEEKKLINALAPKNTEECVFSCNRKFIPQIEKSFLVPLHKQYEFTHLFSHPSEAADRSLGKTSLHSKVRHDRSRPSSAQGDIKRRNKSETEENGFTIMLFSNTEAENFRNVVSSVKELNPQTVRFQVPRNAFDYLQKKKLSLEKKHCVWIFFSHPKGDFANVTLHGLRDSDIAACREDMEQSVFVTKQYHLDPRALLYFRTKCQKSIEKLGKLISLPPVEREGGHTAHKDPYILIKGKQTDIDSVMKELDVLVGPEHFRVEIFTFKCSQCLAYHWKQRLMARNTSAHNAMVQVTLCKGLNDDLQQRTSRSERDSLFNIEVFGQIHDVDEITKSIKENEYQSSIQADVEIPSQKRIQIQDLVKDAGIGDLKVWLSIRGRKVLILAPSFAKDDLEKAKSLLADHFEETGLKTEKISCKNKLAFDIMIGDKSYLDKVNMIGKENQVRIQITSSTRTIVLTGTQQGLEKVKPLVHKAITMAEKSIDSKLITVSSTQSPYLETSSFKKFCEDMKTKFKAVNISTEADGGNTVLTKAHGGSLTIFVVRGDILAEDVDVIVNAANEDLQHIGGLAKTISDRAGPEVQKECTAYVARHGKVAAGNVACLGPGTLPFKNIIHAVAPRFSRRHEDYSVDQKLLNVIHKSIVTADRAGHSSIAIPALGTGIFGIPIEIFAKQAIKAISTFTSHLGSLKEVRIILDSARACEYFQNEIKQCRWLTIVEEATSSSLPNEHLYISMQKPAYVPIRQLPSHELEEIEWKWTNDSGQFQSYDAHTSAILSTKYKMNSLGNCTIVVNGQLYQVNFQTMEQSNLKTNHKRKIMRDSSSHEEEASGDDVEWLYKGDTSQWEPYLSGDSAQLEAWYQSKDFKPTETLRIGKFLYQFDLIQMTQTNTRTSKVREIKRSSKECSAHAVAEPDPDDSTGVQWCFQNDLMEFQPYSPSDSTQLEEWYQLSPSTPPGRLTISGNVYSFDFTSMKQTNISTRKTRTIKREGNDQQVHVKLYEPTTLVIQGDSKSIDNIMMQVQSMLDGCLSNESIDVPKSVKIARIHRIARKYPVELNDISETKVKIIGVQHILQQCVDEIKTEMISRLQVAQQQAQSSSQMQLKVPDEWQQPQKKTVQVFEVMKIGVEWNKVSTKFMETLPSVTIVKIERIQNKWLWEKYSQHKNMLHKKNKGNVNEKQLFHGTRANDPVKIYDSEEGFDMRFSNSGMWGQANYFAVNSSYSDSYAYTDQISGHKQMFLAYVLTGDSYECASNSSLKMPPEKAKQPATYAQRASGDVDLKQLRYDTVSGHTHGSKVFMTYDNLKAYPAYLITYQAKRSGYF